MKYTSACGACAALTVLILFIDCGDQSFIYAFLCAEQHTVTTINNYNIFNRVSRATQHVGALHNLIAVTRTVPLPYVPGQWVFTYHMHTDQ